MIEIGTRVRRFGDNTSRCGTVIEKENWTHWNTPDKPYVRCRVLWDGAQNPRPNSNADRPKKTWVKEAALVEVIERNLEE